ncbi:MAG: MFS transporter [Chloroflexia bacterium]
MGDRATAVPEGSALAWRRLVPPVLALPGYGRLWLTGIIYYFANAFEVIVAGWAVLQMTGSPFAVGLVGFCRTLPMLVLGLLLGSIADRIRETTLLLIVQISSLVAATVIALLFTTGVVQVWQIWLLTVVFGCGWACDFSARRALVVQLSGIERASNALSLETMTNVGMRVLGGVLGGVLLAFGGPRLGYWCLAALYAITLVAVARLWRRGLPVQRPERQTIPLINLVRLGWTTSIHNPTVRGVLLITVVMNLLTFPYQHLIVVVAAEILSVGSERMGLLAGIDGIGSIAIAGTLALTTRVFHRGRVFLIGSFGVTLLVLVLANNHLYLFALGIQVAMGLCHGAFASMQPSLIIGATEPHLRARALGMLAMAIGMGPLGILLAGTLSTIIGPSATLTGMALSSLVLMGLIVARNRTLLKV